MGETVEEIGARLRVLLAQYKQVELALTQDPANEELRTAKKEMQEIITLTEDLFNLKKAEAAAAKAPPPVPATTPTTAPPPPPSSGGTPSSARFQVGDRVQAIYHADGLWYDAVIDAITDAGIYKARPNDFINNTEIKPSGQRFPLFLAFTDLCIFDEGNK